jgi:hypothetical protein
MNKKKKSKMGRPLLGNEPRRILFTVKMTQTEHRAWSKRAKGEEKTLGSWLLEPRRKELEGQ